MVQGSGYRVWVWGLGLADHLLLGMGVVEPCQCIIRNDESVTSEASVRLQIRRCSLEDPMMPW